MFKHSVLHQNRRSASNFAFFLLHMDKISEKFHHFESDQLRICLFETCLAIKQMLNGQHSNSSG